MEYLTLAARAADEFTEKRSRFIGSACPVSTEAEALAFIAGIKAEHPQARHHVYAYILRAGHQMRYSDAGEPSGTGGQPVLGVLQKEKLEDVCLVVTRYFGGILLGAGGLTRAYARAAKCGVDQAGICRMVLCESRKVRCSYPVYEKLSKALNARGVRVGEAQFSDFVEFLITAPAELLPMAAELCRELSAGGAVLTPAGENFLPFEK